MSGIWAIVLAAGESKRMKTQKLLLPFRGKTIIEQVIENILHSEVDKILVVLGSGKENIMKVTERLPVSTCFNESYKKGMLSSVICGLRSLPSSCRAVLVFPGDQPLIPGEVINKVIQAYNDTKIGIIIPVYKGKRGHPVLIDIKFSGEIEKLPDNEGLRMLSYKYPDKIFEVEVNSNGILRDIDTKKEYLNELKNSTHLLNNLS